MLLDRTIAAAAPWVKKRIWIVSDLQQQYPERATHCMHRAMEDFLTLGLACDAVCYLGDAVEGGNLNFLMEMAKMQQEAFAKIDAPVYYVLGNHDFDYYAQHRDTLDQMQLPFFSFIRNLPQWHTQENLSDLYFCADMGSFVLAFLTDHADPSGSWYTTHGEVHGNTDAYPYTKQDYQKAMEQILRYEKPVITLSHYAFAGGNRAAPLFDRFLPLPKQVRMHFYGHAHIGDAVWAGKDCYRQIAAVDCQPIVQVNVASLENYRGSAIRSVIMEWYENQEIGVLFRNHTRACWDGYFVSTPDTRMEKSDWQK